MTRREKKLTDILHNSTSQLGQLLERVFHFNELENNFSKLLDPNFSEHVRLGSYQNGTLILLAESGAFATQLKFRVPDLIEKLRKKAEWSGLRNIDIKVAPHLYDQKEVVDDTPPSEPIKIPEEASKLIFEIAQSLEDIPENKELREALIQLGGKA
jgi:hypothetical protein